MNAPTGNALQRIFGLFTATRHSKEAIIEKALKDSIPDNINFKLSTEPGFIKREDMEAAEAAYRARPTDNSPEIDHLLFRDVIEEVSALNLADLAHELECLCFEMPLLKESKHNPPDGQTRNGYRMAVAFEAGRRYNLLQVFGLLSEEVDSLPATPSTLPQGPKLIQ